VVAAFLGLTTKIHAVVDALGNPLSFHLTPGQACDLDGADQLLPNIVADLVLAYKGSDADERVMERLQAQGKTALIPAKRNRNNPRDYDRDLYQARHFIDIFFAFLKQYRVFGTRYKLFRRNLSGCFCYWA
jgi:transposase